MEEYSGLKSCGTESLGPAMKTICAEHMNIRPGENLLLVADPPMKELAENMADAAREQGFANGLLVTGPIVQTGRAPGGFTTEALAAADAALLVTSTSLSHTDQRRAACYEKGVRIASMPRLTEDMLLRLFKPGKPREISERTLELASRLEGVSRVRVSDPRGTDFELELTGRKIYSDTGLYHSPGNFGNLPSGEVAAAPVRGTLQGRVVVNVAFAGLGAVEPLTLELEAGRLKKSRGVDSGRLLDLLKEPGCRVAGEFGIGTNPLARPCAITLEAEKCVGTVHLGFGDNRSFGGENAAEGHWDAVFFYQDIELDGARLEFPG
jgi:leucyl aminopeptidase (aminopeptidase T)